MPVPFLSSSASGRPRVAVPSASRTRAALIAAAAALCLGGAALAVEENKWTYTSSDPVCNKANTQWTVTNCCTCTVGTATPTPAPTQCAVQFSPVFAGPPTVTVTDQFGNPIFIQGAILAFEQSDAVAQKVADKYGTLSSDHGWVGFQSTIPVPSSLGTNGLVYKVTYTWDTPVAISPDGATWFSDTNAELGQGEVIDAYLQLPVAPGTPMIDGTAGAEYGPPVVLQGVQTQFGDSNLGQIDYANGSELDGGFGFVADGYLWITLAGNLESNFNKLDIFFDYQAGGQNRLRGDNPDVDFNGLNRMGDDGSGNGLTFDRDFAADYYVTTTCGGGPFATYANVAEILTDGGGAGRYIGSGGAGGQHVLYGANGLLLAIDNSNAAGVDGGTGPASGEGVQTGVELQIALPILPGYVGGDIKVCAFVNGGGHDFVSNQVLGGLNAGTGNLGEPRNVNFASHAGLQYFVVPGPDVPCPADLDGDGSVGPADLAILLGAWKTAGADLNGDGVTDATDLALLLGAWGGC